jgi:hypothetical protein
VSASASDNVTIRTTLNNGDFTGTNLTISGAPFVSNLFTVSNPAAPIVSSFTPLYGTTISDTGVVISGSNFSTATTVRIAGTDLPFNIDNGSQISATVLGSVPAGSWAITVYSPGGSGAWGTMFDQNGYPVVSSFTPVSAPLGVDTAISVYGNHFATATSVYMGGVQLPITAQTNTAISTTALSTVPAGSWAVTVINPVGTRDSSPPTLRPLLRPMAIRVQMRQS